MTKEVVSVIDQIDLINTQIKQEYNNRFGVHIVNVCGTIIHITLTDHKARVIFNDYVYYSKLNYSNNIIDAVNRFIEKELEGDVCLQ